ncbi:Pumilio-like protein domain family member 6 [Escovopsis weberi]|uniref:Pumilio-like protein domain family member 6 n=1 Tax=Escovopsis weberi TaxID=150374 RepID=A0A0M8N4Y6_ESCWE|nr:Pumilio-like protein domain family member 6 [Escovopsis weberi]
MATKNVVLGNKRKAASGSKMKADGKSKKARLDETKYQQKKAKEDESESFSDSDDDEGGVKIDSEDSGKAFKGSEKPAGGKKPDQASGQTSRESHAKQKQLALERKAAKPLADEVQRTKKIWERLRLKSHVPKDERQKLVNELYEIITGRIRDFVLKHDAVRAVQTAIKYSTLAQRKQIAEELDGTYAQLAEGRYAKFLIGKLLVHNDDEIRDRVIKNFYGKVRKLINHSEASWILDDIYRTVATKEQKALLLREWYGPEFSLQEMVKNAKPVADLKQILADEPGKRGPIMKNLVSMINSLVQKKMTGFTMLHDAMLQYFLATQPGTEEFSEFVEMVKGDDSGDLLKNMAFTRSGSRLICLMLAYGTAKDRKVFLKAYKDTFHLMSGDQYGHLVILTAYDVIDDTKLTAKSIFPELLGEKEEDIPQNIVAAANNPFARITLLYLLEGTSKSLFPPSHTYDLEILKEVHELRKTTSKKDDAVRRQELVAALSPSLVSAIASASSDLTLTAFGCQFVADVLLSGAGDKQSALEAVAQSTVGDPQQEPAEDDLSPRAHISSTPFGGRMLKSLIQGGRFDKASGKVIPVEPALNFSNTLYPVIKDHVMAWATGPSSFVVVALTEASDFDNVGELKKTLKKNKKLLQKASTEPTAEQKAKQEAARESEKTGKKGAKKAEPVVGNMGSKLLLEKL